MHKQYLYIALGINCLIPSFSQAAAEPESKEAEELEHIETAQSLDAQKNPLPESPLHKQARMLRVAVVAAKQVRRAKLQKLIHYAVMHDGTQRKYLSNITDPTSGKLYNYHQYTRPAGNPRESDTVFAQSAYTYNSRPVYNRFTQCGAYFFVDPYTQWVKAENEHGEVDFESLSLEAKLEKMNAPLEFLEFSTHPL